jgi:hypothetical protein
VEKTEEEGGGVIKEWPDIVCEPLCQWMFSWLGDKVPKGTDEQLPVEAPTAAPPSVLKEEPSAVAEVARPSPTTVEINQIRALQQPKVGTAPVVIDASGRTSSGFIKAGQPVSFEVSFELKGPGASEIAKGGARFHTEIYAQNRSTAAEAIHLSDCEPDCTEENKLSYTTVLGEATLERGVYRLDCVTTLEATPPVQGYVRVPILRVL